MYPKLITLYGPFELNGYNTAIMIGLAVFMYLANRHPARKQLMSSSAFFNLCIEGALVGIIGGRVLHVLSSLEQYPTLYSMVSIWDGGFSILGTVMSVFIYCYWTLYRKDIPFLALTDLATLYAPLLHGIARIGCFLVGCCHGIPTTLSWGVTYTDPQVMAPLHISLHPSQLYSSLAFFLLFGLLWMIGRSIKERPRGLITLVYVMGMSLERFSVDFVRGDRIMVSPTSPLSFYQWIALALFIGAGALLCIRRTSVGAYESL